MYEEFVSFLFVMIWAKAHIAICIMKQLAACLWQSICHKVYVNIEFISIWQKIEIFEPTLEFKNTINFYSIFEFSVNFERFFVFVRLTHYN